MLVVCRESGFESSESSFCLWVPHQVIFSPFVREVRGYAMMLSVYVDLMELAFLCFYIEFVLQKSLKYLTYTQ